MKPRSGGRSSATPPTRKRPAHFPVIESGFRSIIVYLTVCTHQRRHLLANDDANQRIIDNWQAATVWIVGRYVIMPDHIHLFCSPNTYPPKSLKSWVSFWRNNITRAWPNRGGRRIWQRDYWDRQLRSLESYAEKWDYVRNNPVRHGYVKRAEDWPYQGELNVLHWHDR